MEPEKIGFLDDTSILRTPRSPLQASTAVKNNSKKPFNFLLENKPDVMNAYLLQDINHPLNEVTNMSNFNVTKHKFEKTLDSVATDANSSLGILQMDNFSDLTDNSLSAPANSVKPKKKSKKSKIHSKSSREDAKVKKTLRSIGKLKAPEDIEDGSSSDIEFDGTNIPELNFECDILPSHEKTNDNFIASTDQEKNYAISQLELRSNGITSPRDSIFDSSDASYNNLLNQLMPHGESRIESKIPQSEISFKSAIDSIFHKELDELEYLVQNKNRNSNQITSTHSSFKSSSNNLLDFSEAVGEDSIFQKTHAKHENPEDLEDELESEEFLKKLKDACSLQEDNFKSFINDSSSFKTNSILPPETDVSNREKVTNLSYNNFSGANFLSSSALGISESEFKKSVAVIELFQKDEDHMKKENMFEITNDNDFSKDSLATHKDSTAMSWTFASQYNKSPESAQVSIGTLISARTENLGTLSQESCRERPYFGISVSTPTKTFISPSALTSSTPNVSSGSLAPEFSLPSLKSVFPIEKQISQKIVHRHETLSEILDGASVLRPSRLASDIFSKYHPFNGSTANSILMPNKPKEINEETHVEDSLCPNYTTNSKINMKYNTNTFSAVLNDSATQFLSEKGDTTLKESSVSNSKTVKEKNSTDVKFDACPNCQFSLQIPPNSTRPSSSCGSSCSSIPMQSGLNNRFPTTLAAQNFFTNTNNCLHNELFYNVCTMYGSKPGNLPSSQPCITCLSGCNFCHASGTNNFDAVQGPTELQYPEKISIGDSQSFKISVKNTRCMPCLYQITNISATMNDQPMSSNLSGISFPEMVKCSNGNATDIEIILSPKYEGKFEVGLQVAAFFSPAELTYGSSINNPLKTAIKYESLRPSISFSSSGNDRLNMGPIIAGSTVIQHVIVENVGDVAVPLTLNLSSDIKDHHMNFGINQMKFCNMGMLPDFRIVSPKAIFYRLPCSRTNSATSSFDIPIIFEAGENDMDVNFTITASVENHNLKEALAFFNISASVRFAELLLADPSQNPLFFLHRDGKDNIKKSVTIKNQSSIPVVYDLLTEDNDSFSVFPHSVSLQPLERCKIVVSFTSSSLQEIKSSLKAAAQPHGKTYKIVDLIAPGQQVTNYNNNNQNLRYSLPRFSGSGNSGKRENIEQDNIIEVNKKYLAWGGVDIGSEIIKTFTLRNVLSNSNQVKLFVKEISQSFQLLNQNDEKSLSTILDLEPMEEKSIKLVFSPERVIFCSGFLVMKSVSEVKKAAFSIPLSGYGGIGKLKIIGVPEKEGIGYCLDVPSFIDKSTYNSITVKNTGHRAIFIKATVSNADMANYSKTQVSVHPSETVLLEGENKILFVSCNFPSHSVAWTPSDLGIITVMYGDEIMRQKLRRYEYKNGQRTSASSHLGINFTNHYEGEENLTFDQNYQSSPKDVSLFHSNLKKCLIHLNPVDQDQSFSRMNFDALSIAENTYASIFGELSSHPSRRCTSTFKSCHSPPEKELSVACSLPEQVFSSKKLLNQSEINNTYKEKKKEYWIIEPDELTLNSSNKDKRVAIINLSKQDLKFRVECAIDVISVSPVSGFLPAKGEIGLRITIIPYSHNKLSKDYHGHIKILCEGIEKSVLVKVPQDQKRPKDVIISSVYKNLEQDKSITPLEEETFTDATLVPSTNVSLKPSVTIQNLSDFPKDIVLPTTVPGETSETTIIMQNSKNSRVHWDIHQTSILFSKVFENSVYIPHIFELSPSSGILEFKETCTLKIKFSPPNLDNYYQFFEMYLKYENDINQKYNLKIFGKGGPEEANQAKMISAAAKDIKTNPVFKKPKIGVYLDNNLCKFPSTAAGKTSIAYVTLKNNSSQDVLVNITKPKFPFVIKQSHVIVKSKKFMKIPVSFMPLESIKFYEDSIFFHPESAEVLTVKLQGLCLS